MAFNSFVFLFVFFPIFYIVYARAARAWRVPVLLAGSAVFLFFGMRSHPAQMLLPLALTGVEVGGLMCFRRPYLRKKGFLALLVALVTAPLVFYKLSGLVLADPPALPLGLSFYTFQMIAFLVYAYRGGNCPIPETVAGIWMFPKLISGPLAEPRDVLRGLAIPRRKRLMIDSGVQEFVIGLSYKVILADHLGGLLGQIRTWGAPAVSVQLAWLGVLGYALQLYFDFMGYSRMAVGLGRILGIELPENFRHPYCAKTIAQFWRRWHITLGLWFRNYVYIPLGGSRSGTARLVLSTFVVWVLTGIWHGAGWNYVCWGMMMFVLIMGERFLYGRFLETKPVIGHIYVPLLVALSWIFFITPNLQEAGQYFARLVGGAGFGNDPDDWLTALKWCWPYLSLGIVCATPFPQRLWNRVKGWGWSWLLLFALFLTSVYFLGTAASDPFLYFSF